MHAANSLVAFELSTSKARSEVWSCVLFYSEDRLAHPDVLDVCNINLVRDALTSEEEPSNAVKTRFVA